MDISLSVFGLGKLGLPMSVVYASAGYNVIGVDNNPKTVNMLNQKQCPILETNLENLLENVDSKFTATIEPKKAIDNSNITFIIVPTPSEDNDRFTNKYIESSLRDIAPHIKAKGQYHLIVITSTVMPGTMQMIAKPLLEALTGMKCGTDFGLCYSPEFIALGSVIHDMLNPDAVLIGESDELSGLLLEKLYKSVCANDPPVYRMSWWNAEVAKLMLNVFITTKISLANIFAEVCERIPGGDIDKVTDFLGADKRIGPYYLKGGLGFGGPCFPRDNRAFVQMASDLGIECPLEIATDEFNQEHNRIVANRAIEILNGTRGKTVSILGTTYKADTSVVEESSVISVARRLAAHGVTVVLYDPQGTENTRDELPDSEYVKYADTILDCISNSDLCILATAWRQFLLQDPYVLVKVMRTPKVLDCWRVWNKEQFTSAGVEYHAVGVNG